MPMMTSIALVVEFHLAQLLDGSVFGDHPQATGVGRGVGNRRQQYQQYAYDESVHVSVSGA